VIQCSKGEMRKMGMSKKKAKLIIDKALQANLMQKDLERVLILPLDYHRKRRKGQFQLIFGYGEVIENKIDLFIIWDSENHKLEYLPFIVDKRRKRTFSKARTVEMIMKAGKLTKADIFGDNIKKRPICYTNIEQIKSVIKASEGLWSKAPFTAVNRHHYFGPPKKFKKLTIYPVSSNSNFKYISVFLRLFRDASLVMLRDVFDERYNLRLGNQKASLDYDPYSVVRIFLRFIGVYPVRQGGNQKRMRSTQEDSIAIRNILRKECGNKKPSKKQIKEAFEEQCCPSPTPHQIKKYQNILP